MADCTRASGTAHHLPQVESEILPEYLREYQELPGGLGSFAAIEKETGQMAYPDADLMPGAEHGDVVYELTRSDWTRLVNPAETEDRRPGHSS